MSSPIGGSNPVRDPNLVSTPEPAADLGLQEQSLKEHTPGLPTGQQTDAQGLDALLAKAGLATVDGTQAAKDIGPTGQVQGADGLNAAEKLYGAGELKLPPPAAPSIELTPELAQGAEAFAANLDLAIDNFLEGPKTTLAAAGIDGDLQSLPADDVMKAMTTLAWPQAGTVDANAAVTDSEGQLALKDAVKTMDFTGANLPNGITAEEVKASFNTAIGVGINPFTGSPIQDAKVNATALASPEVINAASQTAALRLALPASSLAPGAAVSVGSGHDIDALSSDALIAAFLKININDPNNSVETQNELHQLASDVRQQNIENAQKQAENAEAQQKEAMAYASKISGFVKIVEIVSIVAAVFTLGASLGVSAMASGAAMAASTAAKVALAALNLISAGAQFQSAQKSSDAAEAQLGADRSQLRADQQQQMVEEQAEIINMIMESKNKTVDAVLKMMNASFGTKNKIMSAGMAR